jgi:hypothetical protein
MLAKSDVLIQSFLDAPNMIVVSKHYKETLPNKVKTYVSFLKKSVDVVEKHKLIKFVPGMIFRFGSLADDKYFTITGEYCDQGNNNLLTLDIKRLRGKTEFLQSLCHELVHSEQKMLGTFEWRRGVYQIPYWKGKKYYWIENEFDSLNNRGKYFEYPWEKEAYRRQGELACEVMGLLKEKQNDSR